MILSTGTTSRLPTLEEYTDAVPVATTPCIYPPPLSPGSTSWPNAPGVSSSSPPSPRSFDFEGQESEADAASTSNSDDELLVIVIVALVGLLILIAGCCVFVKCTEAGRYSCLGRLVNDEVDMEGTYAGQVRLLRLRVSRYRKCSVFAYGYSAGIAPLFLVEFGHRIILDCVCPRKFARLFI